VSQRRVISVVFAVSGRFERSKDKCVAISTGTYTVTGGAGAFANFTFGIHSLLTTGETP
jgi:hypothetical protein